jgi:threonine/homoserine/homoserine lactone efflux protein
MSLLFLQGAALGFAAAVQPGPFMAYLVNQTLTLGFRKTWMTAFAPLISDGPIIAIAILVLVQMPAWLQRGLNLLGGLFILYLAWNGYQQWRNFVSPDAAPLPSGRQNILKAAMMNALSPMPYIYWSLVTGPILISGWKQSPLAGLSFLAAFYLVMIASLLAIMVIFGAAKGLGKQVSRVLLGISVLALALYGLLQLWQAFQGIPISSGFSEIVLNQPVIFVNLVKFVIQ